MLLKKSGFLVVLLALLTSCGEKKSIDRFSEVCGITLPEDVSVLKDQRVEAGKDYGVQYTVRLIPKEMKQCTEQIRKSKLYSTSGVEENNKWIKAANGYTFYLARDGRYYNAEVDTVSGVVNYNEAG